MSHMDAEHAELPQIRRARVRRAAETQTRAAAGPDALNSRRAIPTIVCALSLSRMAVPTTPASPPNRACQSA